MSSDIRLVAGSEARDSIGYLWAATRLSLGTASALGFGRFAYGLLLPAMRDDLGWNLAQAGLLTTANAAGYLVGAVVAAVVPRLNATATFRVGMLITTLGLAATALSTDYSALIAARAAAGVGGALVFVAGGVIAARAVARARSSAPVTIYFAGAGIGIAISGATIPPLLDEHPQRWQLGWIGLAICAALATAASWSAARSVQNGSATTAGRSQVRALWRTAIAYLLFAAGYIAYITFVSATLTDKHLTAWQVALAWTLLGVGVMAAPRLWRRPIAHWTTTRTLAGVLLLLAGASALPLLSTTPPVVAISTIGYGATFMIVPGLVTGLIRTATAAPDWPRTLAAFTIIFAAGQTLGPWLAGAIADRSTPSASLLWTAVLCAAAAVAALTERIQGRITADVTRLPPASETSKHTSQSNTCPAICEAGRS
jgi:predicted MFS family arabinose efflux permease